jgi:cell wall assembly regulator SMI1
MCARSRATPGSIRAMPGWWELLHVDGYQLRPGASTKALDAAEAALAIPLPQELRSLYRASDGVFDASVSGSSSGPSTCLWTRTYDAERTASCLRA